MFRKHFGRVLVVRREIPVTTVRATRALESIRWLSQVLKLSADELERTTAFTALVQILTDTKEAGVAQDACETIILLAKDASIQRILAQQHPSLNQALITCVENVSKTQALLVTVVALNSE